MIPGTLRPLPKKIKEVKTEADKILRTSEMDLSNSKEMLSESSLYTFEEVNIQYMRIVNDISDISPLVKESDKLLNKYINDYLLNELVYRLHTGLERTQSRLHNDSQRLETILMSKRKSYIEEMIPRLRDEAKSKLSFLKDLSFDEILEKSQIYGGTISEIVGKLNALRDEYQKLSDGSFDVSEFYAHLKKDISVVEEEIDEYDLILRTCKMQMLAEEAEKMIEEGNVINNEFELDKSSEQVLQADDFVKASTIKFDEMIGLRVSLPRRGISKEFSSNFKELLEQFETGKASLEIIRNNLRLKTDMYATQINWINTIREIAESDGEEISYVFKNLKIKGSVVDWKLFTVKERDIRINPKIKLKGTFTLALLEGRFPVFELSPLGLVKLPLGDELTTEKLEEILGAIDEISKTAFADEIRNRRQANRLLKEKEQKVGMFSNITERLSPAYNKVKDVTKKGFKKIADVTKKGFSKTKSFVKDKTKGKEKKEVKEEKEVESVEEVTEPTTED